MRDAPEALEVRGAKLRIEPLGEATWDQLAALFGEGGDPRWCWCQYWRLRSRDFGALKVPRLRERLRDQARSDEPPGLVALERVAGEGATAGAEQAGGGAAAGAERAVGWVSLGPRSSFERVVRSRVIPTIDDRPVWSVVCFAVSTTARGRGVGAALLEAAVAYAADRGAVALEAYPVVVEPGEPVGPESAFTGTLPMFVRAGFRVVADRASDPSSRHRRVVVRREL